MKATRLTCLWHPLLSQKAAAQYAPNDGPQPPRLLPHKYQTTERLPRSKSLYFLRLKSG